jgi:glycosyltransferase involved in cell wall biosynthesis
MSDLKIPLICLVVPCFNEELALPITEKKLAAELERLVEQGLIDSGSRICFVDDGSLDSTWQTICGFVDAGKAVTGIKLSRNHGHQYALYAGLMEARGDALISLDADLQDDIGAIEDMLRLYLDGKEIVFGVRDDRSSDSIFKRWTARGHYWVSRKLGIDTVPNHADFRLMSRRAIEMLRQYREANLYLRGLVPLLGLETGVVYFKRVARVAGTSKYNLLHMIGLSVRGLTSFSIAPLRAITLMGILVFGCSVLLGIWALAGALLSEEVVPGWASTVIPIYLLGGLQLLALGVVGEYIGKAYMEVKQRPLYQIETIAGDDTEKD